MQIDATLQCNNLRHFVKVKERTLSRDGSIISMHNNNLILNNLACDVNFEGGNVRENIDTMIGKDMLTINDSDDHNIITLQNFLNHRKDDTSC